MSVEADSLGNTAATYETKYLRLRELIDSIPDFIYLKDRQSRYLDGNRSFYHSLGAKSMEEVVGMSDLDFFEPKEAELFMAGEQKLMAKGEAVTIEEQGVKEDGSPRYLHTTKTPIRGKDTGEVVGLVGITRDVSEIYEIREALANQSHLLKARNDELDLQRKQLQILIDHLPDYIYFKDRQSRYVNGNNKFYLGLNAKSMGEIIGKWDFDFFPQKEAQLYLDDELEMFRTGEAISKEEIGHDASGAHRYFHTTKTPIRDPETGEIMGMVGISRDITELKKAREELIAQAHDLKKQKEELSATLDQLKQAQTKLVQSEKMASLGVLTAGIAHEINNPINFVYAGVNSMVKDFEDVKAVVTKMRSLGSATDKEAAVAELQALASKHYFDDAFEALEETLKDIKLGATRITEIVAGLSKFSRLGKETWQNTNIHEDLESVLVLLKNKYKNHIRIDRRFDENLPKIDCFPGKLNQAFMNIAANAIDAIDATERGEGTLTIRTSREGDHIVVAFEDDGIGMDEHVRSKIFDPFFTTKDIGKGVGLGMAITYAIVEDHHGQLLVETAEGKGSTFKVLLPLTQPKP